MRVVPLENEAVNECWIADKDRFVRGAQLRRPADRADDQAGRRVANVDLDAALDYVATGLRRSPPSMAPRSARWRRHRTVEELHWLARHARPGQRQCRPPLRHADFSDEPRRRRSARWLGLPIAALSNLQGVLVVGSFLRKDHPLFAQRLPGGAQGRQGVRDPCAVDDDWLMPSSHGRITAAPSAGAGPCRRLRRGGAGAASRRRCLGDATDERAGDRRMLMSGERKAILLGGNAAAQHPRRGAGPGAHWVAEQTGASVGYLMEAANSVGAQLVGALPAGG